MLGRLYLTGLFFLLYALVHLLLSNVVIIILAKNPLLIFLDISITLVLVVGSVALLYNKLWGKWVILASLCLSVVLSVFSIVFKIKYIESTDLIFLNLILIILALFFIKEDKDVLVDDTTLVARMRMDLIFGSFAIMMCILGMGSLLDNFHIGKDIVINDLKLESALSASITHVNLPLLFFGSILALKMPEQYRFPFASLGISIITLSFITLPFIYIPTGIKGNLPGLSGEAMTLFKKLIAFEFFPIMVIGVLMFVLVVQWFLFERRKFKLYDHKHLKWDYSNNKKYWFDLAYLSYGSVLIYIAIIVILKTFTDAEKIKILPDINLYDTVSGILGIIVMLIIIAGIVISFRERGKKLKALAIVVIPWSFISIAREMYTSYHEVNKTVLEVLIFAQGIFSLMFYPLLFIFATQWFFFERQKIKETS